MSRASRLARPHSKLPSPRRECPGSAGRSRVGEKLMRAGSDGTRQKSSSAAVPTERGPGQGEGEKAEDMDVSKRKISPPKVSGHQGGSAHKQSKSNLKATSPDDCEPLSRRQTSPNRTNPSSRGDAKGSRTVPRRHTLGGARGSREILAMQPSDMDKKREAFLEHLKHKYPHHASAIMGHQERLREQSRSPKHGPSPQPGAGDQADHISLASVDSLEAMSEGDAPNAFTRGSRVRASLPVVRSTNQTKDRSLGVLYLQYGDETKQIRMPNEVTSIDTVRALFVSAFPQQLTMKMLESPSMAVYVKDDMRNVYYELSDMRNITDHSCLKVYHKDPAQAFNHGSRPTNGDARVHGDMVHPGPHPLRQPPLGPPPHHPMQGTLPPNAHSMPPSPSRIPFGPRQSSLPSSATMPRERLSNAPVRSISPCPSAILERRDVKPDEDRPNKSHSLTRGTEAIYAEPYMLANAHGPHPSPGLDGPEHGMGGFHRASIRSTGSYSGPSPTDTMDHPSLYRQKSRNSQLPTLGSKTPPPSPHRMTEVRMIDIHGPPHGIPPHGVPPHVIPPHAVPPHGIPPHAMPPHGMPPHGVPMERGSPVRQSFRKDDGTGPKARGTMGSPVITEVPGHPQGPIPATNDKQTRERMKAMEQQIASLTGLVQHALFKGENTSGTKESMSERPPKTSSPAHSVHSSGGSPVLAPKSSSVPPPDKSPVKVNLLQFRKNVSDLRMQLHQMKQLQLQNQEALRLQLKKAEQEISVKLAEAVQRVEDPVQKQRTVVEEDRHKYLTLEESVLTQLSDLEQYVGSLQKDPAGTQRTVTLKDVEEGAVTLRKVGESLAGLKGEFPALQTRMRAVLRVEVEAVKFLKEEPHKLDSMLKRVKTLTDALSGLRKSASESPQKAPVATNNAAESNPLPSETPPEAPTSSTPSLPPEPHNSTLKSEVLPSSPVIIHQVQSSTVLMQQSQQSSALTAQPSPPLTPSPTPTRAAPLSNPNPSPVQGRESPKSVSVDLPTVKKANGNPASNGNGSFHRDMVIEELQNNTEKSKNRALSIKAAEKEWEERRQNMGHYDGKEFEKILQEAEANMMKGVPNVEGEEKQTVLVAASIVEQTSTAPNTVESPTEESKPEISTEKPVKKAPEKLPKPSKPTLERSSKVNSEQPPVPVTRQTSKDNGTKSGSEKTNKSPPPPPPRKTFSSPTSGMTTTRSGEVVYTRKDSTSTQEDESEPLSPSPLPRSPKVPPETKPKPSTPPPAVTPPVSPPVPKEEPEEGDNIKAELQVFQKCSIQEVEVKNVSEPTTPRIEPQIRELRAPLKDKKTSEPKREEKHPDTDENGNNTLRQSQGVIYYVTGQIPKENPPSPGQEEPTEQLREPPQQPPSQVSNVNVNTGSSEQQQQQQPQQQQKQKPKSPTSPPPISPKPVGLNGFKLPRKHMKRSESMKTSAEMEKGNLRNKINNEKRKEKILKEQKTIITESLTVVNNDKDITAKVVTADMMPVKGNIEEVNEEASLSPDLPGEEAPPPPDNIAFMITSKKVQALSNGEYQELVNAKKDSVETVTVGNASSKPNSPVDPSVPQDNGFNKKPVIIIFDEPMDIRSAYKRLSTIFECEEELERMLAEERIDEESEESDSERSGDRQALAGETVDGVKCKSGADRSPSSSSSSSINDLLDSTGNLESSGDGKDGKKKFKFKFPKKQFAALTQAIRTGTKSGKKTLQVVVYEDEEEADGTVRQLKEAKRFEISRSKSLAEKPSTGLPHLKKQNSESQCRTDEIRKNTYKTLDSLEQTIKQLETTISEMGPLSPDENASTEESNGKPKNSEAGLKRSSSLPSSRGPKVPLKSALKKPKVLPRPIVDPATISTSATTTTTTPSDPSAPSVPRSMQQNASVASPTSRMPVPLSAKSRQSSAEKAGKQQKLQDAQRQFRQANGSAKRVGGDHKTASLSVSKIPAFYPSSTKGSQCVPDHATTNHANSSSPSVTKPSMLPARSGSLPASHIPSLSNGSLKLSSSSSQQHTGKALSFSMQNGRVHPSSSSTSSSSSSPASTPSPLSPTPLGPGGKSIRTIHTPSFNSYKAHNGSGGGKSCIPTAAKDTA